MGLFIGASILTILELFDYLYEVISFGFPSFPHIVKVLFVRMYAAPVLAHKIEFFTQRCQPCKGRASDALSLPTVQLITVTHTHTHMRLSSNTEYINILDVL